MPCIKSLLLASLRFAHLDFFQQQPQDPHSLNLPSLPVLPDDVQLEGDFSEILNHVPSEQIHSILHKHLPATFKDGIFEKDTNAIEAVHRTDPTMATKLLAAARYDLIRRQNGNLTVTTTTPTVIVPVTQTTTNAQGSSVVTTLTAESSATASVVVTTHTTDSAGQTVITAVSVPAVVLTSNGQVTSVPAPTQASDGGVAITTTNEQGSTYVTTFTPGGGVVTSLAIFTSTAPDGSRSTYTSYAIVSKTSIPPGSAATTGPKLQGSATKSAAVTLQGVLVLAITFGLFLI
ncbi:hypothetical protein BT63DRAFT_328454 [Microthyrium microscopicum]|uniref:Uncharacterized protein n=1 Tax=Microthyrium microscopicum TaxID=703497 RepID=A0A6A6U474_9PEZI|nr:hypothetical protein BT63DRAFT_328454 [Microthyrium microscopicum]